MLQISPSLRPADWIPSLAVPPKTCMLVLWLLCCFPHRELLPQLHQRPACAGRCCATHLHPCPHCLVLDSPSVSSLVVCLMALTIMMYQGMLVMSKRDEFPRSICRQGNCSICATPRHIDVEDPREKKQCGKSFSCLARSYKGTFNAGY